MKKQGRADRDVMESSKVEPKSRAVSVDNVANIGLRQIRTQSTQLYKGRGLEAPMHSQATHKAGSQGKHK